MATVLTETGETWLRNSLTGTSITSTPTADFIGWGTGAGTAAKDDLALFAEASTGETDNGEDRVLAERTISGNDIVQWVGTLTANGTKTVTCAGNFAYALSSISGNIDETGPIIHGDFTGVALEANDQIEFTINLQIT